MPFNIGMPEMMIILVIALIVFGPRKLPEIGATVGKAMREFRRASSELTEELTREVDVKKDQERRLAAQPVAQRAEALVPAQTQAYSPEPAVVSSDPLLGSPQDSTLNVPQEREVQPLAKATPEEPSAN